MRPDPPKRKVARVIRGLFQFFETEGYSPRVIVARRAKKWGRIGAAAYIFIGLLVSGGLAINGNIYYGRPIGASEVGTFLIIAAIWPLPAVDLTLIHFKLRQPSCAGMFSCPGNFAY